VSTLGTMTTGHPRWRDFADRLGGPEGCDFQEAPDSPDGFTWDCDHSRDKTVAILRDMGADDEDVATRSPTSTRTAGFCDCEILLNVDAAET
jgi:Protein of unknown function (DUF2695)